MIFYFLWISVKYYRFHPDVFINFENLRNFDAYMHVPWGRV